MVASCGHPMKTLLLRKWKGVGISRIEQEKSFHTTLALSSSNPKNLSPEYSCGLPFIFKILWSPVHENKGAEILGQSVDRMEIALQEMSSVNQLNFIPEYRKHIGWESLGTNPNLHQVACSYHKTLYVTGGPIAKAPMQVSVTTCAELLAGSYFYATTEISWASRSREILQIRADREREALAWGKGIFRIGML